MALELGFILGTEPKLTAVILNGFLQQNILFDAMAGKITANGVGFLEEITTICSMIGMLVLFFSPSLWKAKYLVSWIALFLIVTLGGATGFEFGYNLGVTSGQGILNMPLVAKSNKCTPEEMRANNGFCPVLGAGTAMVEEGTKDVNGAGSTTVASSATYNSGSIDNKLTTNLDNTLDKFSVYAFKPQVFILYLTNKLNFELKSALRGLSSIIMEEKTEALNMVQHTMPGDPQINQWAQAFRAACGSKVQSHIKDANINSILSYSPQDSKAIAELLKNDKITLADAKQAVVTGNLLQKETKNNVPPIINLNVDNNGKAMIDSIAQSGTKTDKDFIKYFTIHEDKKLDEGIIYDTKIPQIYDISDRENIRKRLEEVIDLRDKNDVEDYMDNARASISSDQGILRKNTPVKLTMVRVNEPIAERDKFRAPDGSIKYATDTQSEVMEFDNCGDFYEELVKYNDESLNAFEADLERIIKKSGGRCANETGNYLDCTNAAYTGRVSPEFQAAQSLVNLQNTLVKNCTGADVANECQKISNDFRRMRNEFAMVNSERSVHKVLNAANDTNTIQGTGLTGVLSDATGVFTEAFAGIVTYLGALSNSINVGAYSAILPIIKTILVGFILVLTPIFFLVGLLVPAWSIGVIITPILALLFLQMTDVTMTIVGAVLDSVDKVLSTGVGYGRDDNVAYQGFMELLSAMAYLSSFAITAFLMFAMGDTKTVMSKIAGMDKTIENAGMQIARTGAEMVAAVAKITAGLASGGTMGGSLGAKAASTVAKADVVMDSLKTRGIGDTLTALGGTTDGNYAALEKKHRKDMAETLGEDRSNVAYGEMPTEEKNDYYKELEDKKADQFHVDRESILTSKKGRNLGAGRPKDKTTGDMKMEQDAYDGKSKQPYADKQIDIKSLELGHYTDRDENNKQVKVNLRGQHQRFKEDGAHIMRDELFSNIDQQLKEARSKTFDMDDKEQNYLAIKNAQKIKSLEAERDSVSKEYYKRANSMAQGANYAMSESFDAANKRVLINGKHYSQSKSSLEEIEKNIEKSMTATYKNYGLSLDDSGPFKDDLATALSKVKEKFHTIDGKHYFEVDELVNKKHQSVTPQKPGRNK